MNKKYDPSVFKIPERLTLKTYSHLSENKKMPTEYELTTSKMLYYVEKGGFEVKTPISAWYEQYQQNAAIHPPIWDKFIDPMHTTYSTYIQQQKDEEVFLNTHSRHIDETGSDALLGAQWLDLSSQMLPVLRYPWHGMQMIASYLGSMAPEGKLVIIFAFQSTDEMRRIQQIAYRMRQLQNVYPSFGEHSLPEWQNTPLWQPLRRYIEHLMVTYDWLEGFVALNLCFKPIFDHLLLIHFANIAKKQGDSHLSIMFHSFWEDSCWHQLWSMQLLELLIKEDSKNKSVIQGWLKHWLTELVPAILALKPLFPDIFHTICEDVFNAYTERLKDAGLSVEILWR